MTYRNPVIPGFHPDPSVCRVGDEYFLVASSFTYAPGVPLFRSRNLVDWRQVGNVLDRPSQLDLTGTASWASWGVYAPTIRCHDGRFWMITTLVSPSGATTFYVSAPDPAGPWSDPTLVAIPGIDPDLAWDDEGRCWVHFSGLGGVARCRIDDATGRVLEEPERTWSGTGLQYPEAPHLFRRDGQWYLLIAEGGTERGHAVSIARGPSPTGPWESCPANPIVSHRSTDRPIQNTGHADVVTAPDGSWWMVLLGVRPRRGFHVLGRETFLAPVTWVDGWPEVGPIVLESDARPPGPQGHGFVPGRDDFDGQHLGPHYVGVRRFPGTVASLTKRPGWLTVAGGEDDLNSPEPAFVGRRQQHPACRARARVEVSPGARAGLAVLMDERSHYRVEVSGGTVVAAARIGPLDSVVGESPRPPGPIVLVVETTPAVIADTVSLGLEDGVGRVHPLAQLDGRYLSTEVAGGFTGRVIGMYAVGGSAAFDWFDYQATE